MLPVSRCRTGIVSAGAVLLLAATAACGHQDKPGASGADQVRAEDAGAAAAPASTSPSPSASKKSKQPKKASPSGSPSASASKSASATSSAGSPAKSGATGSKAPAPGSAPDFPVPVEVGNATQVITVKSSGSYATVTAWAKGSAGWKSVLSTSAGRVGSNGVVPGSTRRQSTYTTPSGTYTLTEGFGVEAGGTNMPYTRVNSTHWWVEDSESKFYNSMHSAAGADFPLTESGDRGSEHLVNYPTQYAKALVINFNRWPAVPGRGAGIFLHVNGSGATAGCVSVPRATMDRIMSWVQPGAHPRIAIG
ncbi:MULTISPECIES: L,D-transpeptidase family protein [unclassified Streptomyces]|uniref:L,D-transpeptidase family protein n=1 Tax=Streptomyces sp. NBC_00119 TaxID=2975659 RepID=A0AAU1U9W9_9ACTN|nr:MULTISPECIES: L,D-transpeptidase family protein [unclassified Streptomyces]MCX4643596.1 L,D-transpeptidase family protein [Streptomyces sp. NBC_01446]MCX5324719.1 L,D-transpeptidase family protein [Streptomyces sp. NBC_00120]